MEDKVEKKACMHCVRALCACAVCVRTWGHGMGRGLSSFDSHSHAIALLTSPCAPLSRLAHLRSSFIAESVGEYAGDVGE